MTKEIIIPQNALGDAKGRLAGYMGREQRAWLARELLVRSMTVAREVAPVAVVSPAPELATLVREARVRFILQRRAGLNGGVADARDNALRRGVAVVAIVHADLPIVEPADLEALLTCAEAERIAIAPDAAGTGTNALAVGTATPFIFRFGPGSFLAHRLEALRIGLPFSVVRRRALSLDLDTPDDLLALLADERAAWIRSVIQFGATRDGLGSRLSGVSW